MSATERVAVYVDGFNLYFGIRGEGRRYLWLDLEELARRILKPHQRLVTVRYFTARVRNDPPAEQRQQTYLNALAAHSSTVAIRQGRYQQKTKSCHSCRASWSEYEEKETDVSLAVSLVEDCVNDVYDTALIISADSDMCPGIRAVKRLRPKVRVVAAFPPKRQSGALRTLCDATVQISMTKVRQAQLPENVQVGTKTYVRPPHWK